MFKGKIKSTAAAVALVAMVGASLLPTLTALAAGVATSGDLIFKRDATGNVVAIVSKNGLVTPIGDVLVIKNASGVPTGIKTIDGTVISVGSVSGAADAGTLTGTTLAANVVNSSLTSTAGGTLRALAFVNPGSGVASAAASATNSAGGLAALDSSARLPEAQLPSSVLAASAPTGIQLAYSTAAGGPINWATPDSSLTITGAPGSAVIAASGGGSSFAFSQKSTLLLMNIPSGNFTAANGSFTLGTAMDVAHAKGYGYISANGINGTNAAGLYYWTNVGASTTTIKFCNNIYTPGTAPTIPASCTAFTDAIVQAYTGTTATITVARVPIPANSLGVNGGVDYEITFLGQVGASGMQSVNLGASLLGYINARSATVDRQIFRGKFVNTGVADSQLGFYVLDKATGSTSFTQYTFPSVVDTTSATTATITLAPTGATNWIGVLYYNIKPVQ